MDIINGLENISEQKPSVITMGTFDGLHNGHTKIIEQVVQIAEKDNLKSILLTFEPHPQLVLKNKIPDVQLLSTIEEKLELLKKFQLDLVIVIEFNREFSQYPYQDFVKEILISKLKMNHLVIGYDHHFGKNREGNIESVQNLSQNLGFKVSKVEPLYNGDQLISSSLIRQLIARGEMDDAARYLGRLYPIKGTVIRGDGRGKKMSFPTANMAVENKHKIVPGDGVYAVDVEVLNKPFKGMMNIGERPTFSTYKALEVNIFGLDNDIYEEKITVKFKKRLRDEIKFSSVDELVNQLKSDKEQSLKY
jgi:riboflavin kinase/FMN adenylyltransferase